MIPRTAIQCLPDGRVAIQRYGMVLSRDEALELAQNLLTCLEATEPPADTAPRLNTQTAVRPGRPAGPTPAQTGSGI